MNIFKQALLKFQALSLRERMLVVMAMLVGLFLLTDWAVLGPQRSKNKVLQQQIAQQKTDLDAMAKVIAESAANQKVDTLVKERLERDDLRAKLAQAESFIGTSASQVRLGETLRAMIGGTPDLTLVSLKTMPAEVFYAPPAAPKSQPSAASGSKPNPPAPQLTLYKHGVDVTMKGKYPALLSYLQSLQRSPNRMFWFNVKLDVGTYPEASLRITIYTLSDRAESPLG